MFVGESLKYVFVINVFEVASPVKKIFAGEEEGGGGTFKDVARGIPD